MKILVIDSRFEELDAAVRQLKGHNISIASKFSDGRDFVRKGCWDIVLTDLMLPAEGLGMSKDGEPFVGEPTPSGLVLALMALQMETPKVAIVSNGDRHSHPLIWACDALLGNNGELNRESRIIPGLWAFTGFSCPMSGAVKSWVRVMHHITAPNDFEMWFADAHA